MNYSGMKYASLWHPPTKECTPHLTRHAPLSLRTLDDSLSLRTLAAARGNRDGEKHRKTVGKALWEEEWKAVG